MKTIQLKTELEKIVIGGKEVETEINTSELLKVAINSTTQGGYTVSEMLIRVKLLDVIESAIKQGKSEISFEDADYSALGKLVKDTKWSIISRTIIDLAKEFDK